MTIPLCSRLLDKTRDTERTWTFPNMTQLASGWDGTENKRGVGQNKRCCSWQNSSFMAESGLRGTLQCKEQLVQICNVTLHKHRECVKDQNPRAAPPRKELARVWRWGSHGDQFLGVISHLCARTHLCSWTCSQLELLLSLSSTAFLVFHFLILHILHFTVMCIDLTPPAHSPDIFS